MIRTHNWAVAQLKSGLDDAEDYYVLVTPYEQITKIPKGRTTGPRGQVTLLNRLRNKYAGRYRTLAPIGFVTNGSSIPRIAWTTLGLTPMVGPHVNASIGHDMRYTNHRVQVWRDGNWRIIKCSRSLADLIFYEDLLTDGGRLARQMFDAVHIHGKDAWESPALPSVPRENLPPYLEPVYVA